MTLYTVPSISTTSLLNIYITSSLTLNRNSNGRNIVRNEYRIYSRCFFLVQFGRPQNFWDHTVYKYTFNLKTVEEFLGAWIILCIVKVKKSWNSSYPTIIICLKILQNILGKIYKNSLFSFISVKLLPSLFQYLNC